MSHQRTGTVIPNDEYNMLPKRYGKLTRKSVDVHRSLLIYDQRRERSWVTWKMMRHSRSDVSGSYLHPIRLLYFSGVASGSRTEVGSHRCPKFTYHHVFRRRTCKFNPDYGHSTFWYTSTSYCWLYVLYFIIYIYIHRPTYIICSLPVISACHGRWMFPLLLVA